MGDSGRERNSRAGGFKYWVKRDKGRVASVEANFESFWQSGWHVNRLDEYWRLCKRSDSRKGFEKAQKDLMSDRSATGPIHRVDKQEGCNHGSILSNKTNDSKSKQIDSSPAVRREGRR